MPYMPTVVENSGGRNERVYDLPSRLMKDRIIMLSEDVNPLTANILVMQMLFLESQDSKKPINFYINSPGGSVSDGISVYDTMKFLKCPVHTLCMGMAASMGAFLLGAGEKGHRMILPHARVMVHQVSGSARGQSTNIQIEAREIQKVKDMLESLMAEHTGQTVETIHNACERDNYMSAEEAMKFGIVDEIIGSRKAK